MGESEANRRFYEDCQRGVKRIKDEYADMSDADLIALEESLYDDEVAGDDVWAERDRVLWEMNRRGLCSSTK